MLTYLCPPQEVELLKGKEHALVIYVPQHPAQDLEQRLNKRKRLFDLSFLCFRVMS